MSNRPHLRKTVWTDADFETMGWHDNAVHAIALEAADPYPGRLLLDLDYIIEWVQPTPPATTFTFWTCPATLVFDWAWDLTADIDLTGSTFELHLDSIERSDTHEDNASAWTLAGHEFSVGFHATGFTQYLRRLPIHTSSQRLTLEERGGISFDLRATDPPRN